MNGDDTSDDTGHQNRGESEGEPSGNRRLSGRAKIILAAVVVLAIVAGGLWFLRYQSTGKYLMETNDARIEADMVTVAPRVAGYVSEVFVSENQDVRAGQPLLRIDPRNARANAAQAQAQIALAAAQAEGARAQIAEQQAVVDRMQAQLSAARVKAAEDAAQVRRYGPLAASGAETREKLEQFQSVARQSAAEVRAQEAAVVAQQRRIGSIRAQVRQGEAQGEAARAQFAAADVDVTATLLRAAIDGRVGDKTVTQGQYVQPGTRLMSIVPLKTLYVTANFKETQLALMRPGQPATISIDALGGLQIRGRVESLAPGTGAQFSLLPPQNATGNFTKITQRVPVRIAIIATPEARRLLVPGLSVVATVDTRSARAELDRIRDRQEQLEKRSR